MMKLNNTKAGMSKVDVSKVEKVLNSESAQESEYYKHLERMNARARGRIDVLVRKTIEARKSPHIIRRWEREVDREVKKYPEPDLSQTFLHMDMDAFFASVEIRDNPSYAAIPIAVGSISMISTSNYVARRFGVRAGMAGFIGLQLCPSLIIVPGRFEKYEEVGMQIRERVLVKFDPKYRSFSCDEASLNITKICAETKCTPMEIGRQIKNEVYNCTGLTCSVGIGPNATLAKIASEERKPDGLHELSFYEKYDLTQYVHGLQVRKVPSLGRRTEEMLLDIGIRDLGDIYYNRGLVWGVFPRKTALFYILNSFGIFSTDADNDSESDHSISKERTFAPLKDKKDLMRVFYGVLSDAMLYYEEFQEEHTVIQVTLKLKYSSFDVKQRSTRIPKGTKHHKLLADTAERILAEELYPLDLRLIGVKFTLKHDSLFDFPPDKKPHLKQNIWMALKEPKDELDVIFQKTDETLLVKRELPTKSVKTIDTNAHGTTKPSPVKRKSPKHNILKALTSSTLPVNKKAENESDLKTEDNFIIID